MKPAEIFDVAVSVSESKGKNSLYKLLILGFLAGAFIAFGAQGSNMAAYNLLLSPETYGLGRALSGVIFSTGLMMVVLAGAELFTGNTLMLLGVLDKKIRIYSMLRNWIVVYIGNMIGSIFIAYMMSQSGLFDVSDGALGALTVKIGAGKTALPFCKAFILGIMCNWLVCLAVWISFGAENTAGKILGILFPIWLFVTSGFEHSVANMYYIPAAIFAKADFAPAAVALGLKDEALASLDWCGFFVDNLIPVTMGNIVGGCIFVALAYWISFKKN